MIDSPEAVSATADGFRSILPPLVRIDGRAINPAFLADLLPEEATLASAFIPDRKAEFATGRASLRRLLSASTHGSAPILIGRRREPLLPESVVGTITHCSGIVVAAVAPRDAFHGIGIDMEMIARITPDLGPLVMSGSESAGRPASLSATVWLAMHFSAKEAVFKAIHELIQRYIDFLDIRLSISEDTFVATPCFQDATLRGRQLHGAIRIVGERVIAGAWIDG